MNYPNHLKKAVCEAICIERNSTIQTAELYGVPLKTVENWVTAYNKDANCFNKKTRLTPAERTKYSTHTVSNRRYQSLSRKQLQEALMKKDIELARLKKRYAVRKRGTKKGYVSFSTKNMK